MAFNSGTVGIRQPPPAPVRFSVQALAWRQLLSWSGPTYQSRPVTRSVITPLLALINLICSGLTSAMGCPWPSRELLLAQPHTTNKIKAIMLQRYQRGILFKPPGVIWVNLPKESPKKARHGEANLD